MMVSILSLNIVKGTWSQYCKRGYFAGGKFRENFVKTFHVGVIFTILLIFP